MGCEVTSLHCDADPDGIFFVDVPVVSLSVHAFWCDVDVRVLSRTAYAEVFVSCMILGGDVT